ncbi:hypothetical protein [Lacunimicrobium album]
MSNPIGRIALRILGFLLAIPSIGLFLWGMVLYLSTVVRFEQLPEAAVVCGTSALGGVLLMLVSSPLLVVAFFLIILARKVSPA